MDRKQYSLLVALVIVSGIVGGGLSNWFFMGEFAFAKKLTGKSLLNEKIITTEELRIIDDNGREHITIGPNQDGDPRIVFWNVNNNKSSIVMGLNKDKSPGMTFWDVNGKSRATLVLNDNGDPVLRFIDKDGRTNCVTLGMTNEGEPELALFDKGGKKRAEFVVTSGETSIGFLDDKGIDRLGLGMLIKSSGEVSETPVLFLSDRGEKAYWGWNAIR